MWPCHLAISLSLSPSASLHHFLQMHWSWEETSLLIRIITVNMTMCVYLNNYCYPPAERQRERVKRVIRPSTYSVWSLTDGTCSHAGGTSPETHTHTNSMKEHIQYTMRATSKPTRTWSNKRQWCSIKLWSNSWSTGNNGIWGCISVDSLDS